MEIDYSVNTSAASGISPAADTPCGEPRLDSPVVTDDNFSRPAPLRIGLVGYGAGGHYFHSPFIVAAGGVELAGIVARDPAKRTAAASDHPGVPVVATLGELVGLGVDALVITTPPHTREELVLEAIAAGLPTVVDKPFAPDARVAARLVAAADQAGVLLNAFHNRRLDGDVLTVKKVIESGGVGTVRRFTTRYDLDEPHTIVAGPGGGVLSDLGSHLVDQAYWLFGPAASVYAELTPYEVPGPRGGASDSGFFIAITHVSGVVSHLYSSKIAAKSGREYRVDGDAGVFISAGDDPQAIALYSGRRPVDDRNGWGAESVENWGTLHRGGTATRVPAERGDWTRYYERFGEAVRAGTGGPVPAADAVEVLRIIDAARISALTRTVEILDSRDAPTA